MSAKADKNYVSIAALPSGELWLVDYRRSEGQTHQLIRGADEHDAKVLSLGDIIAPEDYQDALKLSGATNVSVMAGEVRGGTEDCVDINHSRHCRVVITRAVTKGRFLATIKGGSFDINLAVLETVGRGRETDIDLGNWSDQSQKPTKGITLFAGSGVAAPLRVRVLNGDKPAMSPKGRFKYNGWLRGWFPLVQKVLKLLKLA